jgi:hypothetical protein
VPLTAMMRPAAAMPRAVVVAVNQRRGRMWGSPDFGPEARFRAADGMTAPAGSMRVDAGGEHLVTCTFFIPGHGRALPKAAVSLGT